MKVCKEIKGSVDIKSVKEIVGSNASLGGNKTSPNNLSQGAACGTLLSSHRKNAKRINSL